MATKVISYLTTALILSLGFGQFLRFETSLGPLYLHDILVLTILLFSWRLAPALLNEFGTLKLFLLGLLIGYLRALTLYPFHDLLIPLLFALRLLVYLATYFVIKHANIRLDDRLFAVSGLICLVIGLSQYFLMPDLRLFQYLGWDDHLNRLTFPHFDPTFTGVMLSLYGLTTATLGFRLVSALALLFTYSRSVWISLLVTLSLTFKNKLAWIGFLFLFSIGVVSLPRGLGEGNNLLRVYSISSRVSSDLAYIRSLGYDLIVGQGLNTLVIREESTPFPTHSHGPNNSYLYLLATTGLLGLLGWLKFLFNNFNNPRSSSILIFLLVASLFNNVMFYPFVLLYLLLWQATART